MNTQKHISLLTVCTCCQPERLQIEKEYCTEIHSCGQVRRQSQVAQHMEEDRQPCNTHLLINFPWPHVADIDRNEHHAWDLLKDAKYNCEEMPKYARDRLHLHCTKNHLNFFIDSAYAMESKSRLLSILICLIYALESTTERSGLKIAWTDYRMKEIEY